MHAKRKLAAILFADIVGFSRLTHTDEDRTLARVRALRGDVIAPAVTAHDGRIVKGTGDGVLVEFRSVVDAARCAIEIQEATFGRNSEMAPDRRLDLRIGIHVGDVTEDGFVVLAGSYNITILGGYH